MSQEHHEALKEALDATGYPVAYRAFSDGQEPPFICYLFASSADFIADDTNYAEAGDYQVELYTELKDFTAEAAVEAALVTLGVTWVKTETYLDSEDMYQILYDVRLATSASLDDESI